MLLAACLAQAPQVLLLDEPSTHLDIDQQLHCFSLLRDESHRGAACLIVTHDLNLALAYATRLIVIADGRVALDVPVEDAARTPGWLSLFSPRLTMSIDSVRPSVGVVLVTSTRRDTTVAAAVRRGVLPRGAGAAVRRAIRARLRAAALASGAGLVDLRATAVSRTVLGLFAGGALSLAGALFQAMLRDALATPYTLGISAGASLGAVVAIWLDWQQVAGLPAIWIAALAGAAIVLVLVVGAACQQRQMSTFSLLLSGLAANSVCSALIIVIYGLVSSTKSFSITRWLIGSLDSVDYTTLTAFVAAVTVSPQWWSCARPKRGI